jgi:hypothetical protein
MEQLLHEQFGAAGDAGVVIVAEVEQAHQRRSTIAAPGLRRIRA